MRIRRALLQMFRDHADREGLTFYAVARWGCISEPRAWNLLNGPMEQFNSETLIDLLERFGFTVEVSTSGFKRPRRYGLGRGRGRGVS